MVKRIFNQVVLKHVHSKCKDVKILDKDSVLAGSMY